MSFINHWKALKPAFILSAVCMAIALLGLIGCAARGLHGTSTFAKEQKTFGTVLESNNAQVIFKCSIAKDEDEQHHFFFVIPPEGYVSISVEDGLFAVDGSLNDEVISLDQLIERGGNLDPLKHLVKFQEVGFVRFWRLGSLTINSGLIVGEGSDRFRPVEFKIALNFLKPPLDPSGASARVESALSRERGMSLILKSLIENPDDLARFAADAPPIEGAGENRPQWLFTTHPEDSEFWIKIPVSEDDVYAISPQTLTEMDLTPSFYQTAYFRLFNKGREIPMLEMAGEGEKFTGTNRLLFTGEKSESRYSTTNIYWLAYTPEQLGARTATIPPPPEDPSQFVSVDSFTDTYRWEEELDLEIHRGNFLSIEEIRWVGPTMDPDKWIEHTFDLPGLLEDDAATSVKVKLRFFLKRDAKLSKSPVQIKLNGKSKYESEFHVRSVRGDTIILDIPSNVLRENHNTLLLMQPAPAEMQADEKITPIRLDFVEVIYPRRFEAIDNRLDIMLPARVLGSDVPSTAPLEPPTLVAPDGFTNFPVIIFDASDSREPQSRVAWGADDLTLALPARGEARVHYLPLGMSQPVKTPMRPIFDNLVKSLPECDYLIIFHEDFIDAVEPLRDWHEREGGLRTALVEIRSVYDEFNYGIESPQAIKQFLNFLLEDRGPEAPSFVLLVGDCSSDYKNYAHNEVKNYIPSYSYQFGSSVHESWASDHWFTTCVGDDDLSDYILGRFSVNSEEDARNVVAKTLNYLSKPHYDPWRSKITYVADDGEFSEESEILRTRFTPFYFLSNTIYLEDQTWVDNFYLPKARVDATRAKVSPEGTTRVMNAFNEGTLYLSYFGHGSPNIWCDERLWFGGDSKNSDNLLLTNADRPTFVVNMTCNSGAIDYPIPLWNVCITEDMMRVPNGGAIGVFAPSGPGFSSAHQVLAQSVRRSFFDRKIRGMGETATLAKLEYALRERTTDLVKMFIFLGDPALELQMPKRSAVFDPVVASFEPDDKSEVSFSVNTDVESGKGWFFLYDDTGRILDQFDEIPFNGGKAKITFKLPAEPAFGEWYVSGYFSNAEEGVDSLGGARVLRYAPWVSLESFSEGNNEPAKENLEGLSSNFQITLANLTPLPTDNNVVVVERLADGGKWKELKRLSLSLNGNEKKTWKFDIVGLPAGFSVLRARLADQEIPLKGDHEANYQAKVGIVPTLIDDKGSPESALVISPELIQSDLLRVSEGESTVRFEIPVFNQGAAFEGTTQLIAVTGDGQEFSSTNQPIRPGEMRMHRLTVFADESERSNEITFMLKGEYPLSSSKDEQKKYSITLNMPHPPIALADVFVREARPSNDSPTEGETIFIDVVVANRGKGAAQNILVAAYDKPRDEGGEKLKNMTAGKNDVKIPYLAPGSETTVRLRWDPFENLGQDEIFIILDAQNSIIDSNRSNNMYALPLKVRSKAKLAGRGIAFLTPTEEERRKKQVRLEAKVINLGESEARGVVVAVFKTPENKKEDKIGEAVIPEIGPGETKSAVVTWLTTEEDREKMITPSYLIYLRGSLRRTVGTTDDNSPEE